LFFLGGFIFSRNRCIRGLICLWNIRRSVIFQRCSADLNYVELSSPEQGGGNLKGAIMVKRTKKSVRFDKSSEHIQRMPEVELINISKTGACLGSSKSLAPGSYVRMRFVSDKGTFNINGFIVRSNLSTLKNGVPYYHAGVKFSEEFALELGSCQSILKQLDEPPEAPIAEKENPLDELSNPSDPNGEARQYQTIFELTASLPSSVADLKELLKGCESNSWVDF
jgi:hypothetical protein